MSINAMSITASASVMAVVLVVAVVALLWRDPFLLVRLEGWRLRRAARLRLRHVQVAGHRWAYVERAAADPRAPTVVMVHGFTGSKENWYRLARALGNRYRLLIPDLPGWAESERRSEADYGYLAQARHVAEFIERVARRPGGEVVLLGHSMGGGVAALVAAWHPSCVDRLGLLNPAGVRFEDNVFASAVEAGDNPFAVHDAASLRAYLDTLFVVEACKPRIPWPASRAVIAWRRRERAFEQRVLDRIGRGEERFMPGEAAAAIRQPVLLLGSRQDAVIDASALDLYAAQVPQATKVLLDGCGHMSLMEQPDAVAAAVVALIDGAGAESTQ